MISASLRGLYRLEFGRGVKQLPEPEKKPAGLIRLLRKTESFLRHYFAGRRASFEDLPVDWTGYRPFERCVLRALRRIPLGSLESYSSLAGKAGRPKAARYVGNVLGRNRLPIIVPCHRIVRKGTGWGGFSRGIRWKRELLKLEGVRADKKLKHQRTN